LQILEAATAVMLIGIMPVYVTAALGGIVFAAPLPMLRGVLYAGLALPFAAGLWGVRSIYVGFLGQSDTLPPQRRCQRECWLRRLTAAYASNRQIKELLASAEGKRRTALAGSGARLDEARGRP